MVQSWKINFPHLGKYFIHWRSFPGNELKYVSSSVKFKSMCENSLKWVRRLWQTLKRVKNCVLFNMYVFALKLSMFGGWNRLIPLSSLLCSINLEKVDHSNAYLFYFWMRQCLLGIVYMANYSIFFTTECVLGWCLYLLLSKVISSDDIKFKNFIKCYAKNPPCLLTVRITIKAISP